MVTNFGLKMIIMILMGLLMGASRADVGPKHKNKHLPWAWNVQTNYQSERKY